VPVPVPVPVPAEPAPAAAAVTDTTVDELLDKLNSGGMGEMAVGDQFRVNGELFMSELWRTGVTGDFYALLKTCPCSQIRPTRRGGIAPGWLFVPLGIPPA
jgi:hypothetical protein